MEAEYASLTNYCQLVKQQPIPTSPYINCSGRCDRVGAESSGAFVVDRDLSHQTGRSRRRMRDSSWDAVSQLRVTAPYVVFLVTRRREERISVKTGQQLAHLCVFAYYGVAANLTGVLFLNLQRGESKYGN